MTELIAGAFMAGLLGSPHCIGMCGGFAGLCGRSVRGSVAWHGGRLSTYATLGALCGWAGSLIHGPAWIPLAVSAVLMVWFAGVLAGVLPQTRLAVPGISRAGSALAKRGDLGSRYLFGLVTSLLPCGLVYAALGFAVAGGSALAGALAMLAFGFATVPALALLTGAVHRLAARGLWFRRAIAAAVLLIGVWSIVMRGMHAL